MKIAMFYHSVLSDWNHGNAHFLRGVATELLQRGHEVALYEPEDSWSLQNLLADHGTAPIADFQQAYPRLHAIRYHRIDLKRALRDTDLVIVHEWNDSDLVLQIGMNRSKDGVLLFHDTHHRIVTQPEAITTATLENYDGVLAYGRTLQHLYQRGIARRAWIWHEAADTRVFRPIKSEQLDGDLVWIGNWGDGERTAELEEFLIAPVEALGLRASVFGVRYPAEAIRRLASAGIQYCGWTPNFRVPEIFSRFRITVHIPRRPYVNALRGIPTIRPFEALACGIPLVCSPWHDDESLFSPGEDYLVARNKYEMMTHIECLVRDDSKCRSLISNGLNTIKDRHTCGHRVDQLLAIYREIRNT